MRNNRSMLFAANIPDTPDISNVFKLNEDGTIITGFDDKLILSSGIAFDLSLNSNISAISSYALAGFDKLTSLSIGNVKYIDSTAFGYSFNELVLPTAISVELSDTNFNTLCVYNMNT